MFVRAGVSDVIVPNITHSTARNGPKTQQNEKKDHTAAFYCITSFAAGRTA